MAGTATLVLAAGPLPFAPAEAAPGAPPPTGETGNWYERSFFLLHLDHHTGARDEVGKAADPAETARLLALARPDVIQIHAKVNPGWTTYPTKIGHTPPKLARDVLRVWTDIARRDGYHWSVYYNIGRDAEIMRRKPEWNRVKADGTPHDRALCYHSGVAENYLWPMIDEILAAYRPDGLWFDGSVFTIRTCYCNKCQARFGRESGLPAPPKNANEPGWAAFKEMHRQIYREFVAATSARIKKAKPDCLVAFNWAYALHMPEAATAHVDYLTGDNANDVDRLSVEVHWYDGQRGKPFDLMTTIFVNEKAGATNRLVPKPTGQMEQEMALVIANGGRYFAWDNPNKESGLTPERYEYLQKVVSPFLRVRQAWCRGSERVPAVSLLNSAAHHYAASHADERVFVPRESRVDSAADGLRRLHLDYEMLTDGRLEKNDVAAPLLLVEDPLALTKETVAALRRFAERGGTVLLTGAGVVRVPGLDSLLGLAPAGETLPGNVEETTVLRNGQTLRLRESVVLATPAPGTQTLLAATNGAGKTRPLLTRRAAGKGQVLCCLIPLFTPRDGRDVPAALVEAILQQALPEAARPFTTNAPATVETILRRKGIDQVLHLVNRAPGKRERVSDNAINKTRITDIAPVAPCRVTVRVPARPARVMLEPQGTALAGWNYENNRITVDLPGFAIHQMVVFHSTARDTAAQRRGEK